MLVLAPSLASSESCSSEADPWSGHVFGKYVSQCGFTATPPTCSHIMLKKVGDNRDTSRTRLGVRELGGSWRVCLESWRSVVIDDGTRWRGLHNVSWIYLMCDDRSTVSAVTGSLNQSGQVLQASALSSCNMCQTHNKDLIRIPLVSPLRLDRSQMSSRGKGKSLGLSVQ